MLAQIQIEELQSSNNLGTPSSKGRLCVARLFKNFNELIVPCAITQLGEKMQK